MIDKNISRFLNELSDNLIVVNKLIVATYLEFNQIEINNNKLILSCIEGVDKESVEEFMKLVKLKNRKLDLEDVIHLFETSIPIVDISVNGAVYTPKFVKDYIVHEAFIKVTDKELSDIQVADIACGTGAFLYTVAQKIKENTNKCYFDIFKQNIFGLDISNYTINRAKILLSLLAISNGEDKAEFDFNLNIGNALDFEWQHVYTNFEGFDIVLGNPPYVRAKNISDQTKVLLHKWKVTQTGNPDLYIPFFEIGLKCLRANGILGFITVNTFKRSINARGLREYFKENSFDIELLDFGSSQIFIDKVTYTCIAFITNRKSNEVKYQKITVENFVKGKIGEFVSINYNLLDTKKGWILNKLDTLKNIKKIESEGISFGDKFVIRNGLATLANDIFIFKPTNEDERYFYLQSNQLHKIEKGICREIIKPNTLKKEVEISNLKEQIIFPYYDTYQNKEGLESNLTKKNVFEEEYFLTNFPNAYTYLLENKEKLLNRDKGKEKKYLWYEFGRTQALNNFGKKLFFPYMASQPYFVFSNEEELLFYAGYAVYCDSERELMILKRILESKVFWYYIKKTSKPYSGNYFALAKNYVKDFGICTLTETEENYLLSTKSFEERSLFLLKKYNLDITEIES